MDMGCKRRLENAASKPIDKYSRSAEGITWKFSELFVIVLNVLGRLERVQVSCQVHLFKDFLYNLVPGVVYVMPAILYIRFEITNENVWNGMQ